MAKPETVDIACYAVANNPVAELGQAVRDALRGSRGKVAVSLLNLLGQRRDTEAVGLMVPFLKDEQADVAAAAAAPWGKSAAAGRRRALDHVPEIRSQRPAGRWPTTRICARSRPWSRTAPFPSGSELVAGEG